MIVVIQSIIALTGILTNAYISHKNTKSSNKEKIATELLENFFAPNSEKIELMLYKELTPDIKQKLLYLQNEHKKQLIYFSTDFTIAIRKIIECPDNKLKYVQGKFDLVSVIYLKTLNKTRTTLGLPKLSIRFRIANNLFQNPKTAKRLELFQTILKAICLISLLSLMTSIYFFLFWHSNPHYLRPFMQIILFASITGLTASLELLLFIYFDFKY